MSAHRYVTVITNKTVFGNEEDEEKEKEKVVSRMEIMHNVKLF